MTQSHLHPDQDGETAQRQRQNHTEAGRQDLADKENAEIEILNRYLPQMMSAEEIKTVVEAVITETGASGMADMGKVMGVLKTRLAGKADMGEVNKVFESRIDCLIINKKAV